MIKELITGNRIVFLDKIPVRLDNHSLRLKSWGKVEGCTCKTDALLSVLKGLSALNPLPDDKF